MQSLFAFRPRCERPRSPMSLIYLYIGSRRRGQGTPSTRTVDRAGVYHLPWHDRRGFVADVRRHRTKDSPACESFLIAALAFVSGVCLGSILPFYEFIKRPQMN